MPSKTPFQDSDPCSEMEMETISLSRDDVIPAANNDNRIVFASLYSYADAKDESAFKKIYLPPICVPGLDLFNMFYVNKRLAFSPYVLNTLVGSIKKLPLIEAVMSAYEESTGNSRSALSAQQKILIRQELSTQQINNKIQRIVHLNYDDFQEAFKDEEMWYDEIAAVEEVRDASDVIITPYAPGAHKNLSSVEIHVYSDSLQMGFILIVQFVSWVEDDIEWPCPFSPGLIGYEALQAADSSSLACDVCVSYTPVSM